MNTDKLQAGRKLDIKVAKLMGWTPGVEDYEDGNGPVKLWLDERGNMIAYQEDYWEIDAACGRWSPSEDISHADLIIDHLVTQGYAVTIYTGQYQDQGAKARCCILHLADLPAGPVDAITDKRPLAICRAALKARERWGG